MQEGAEPQPEPQSETQPEQQQRRPPKLKCVQCKRSALKGCAHTMCVSCCGATPGGLCPDHAASLARKKQAAQEEQEEIELLQMLLQERKEREGKSSKLTPGVFTEDAFTYSNQTVRIFSLHELAHQLRERQTTPEEEVARAHQVQEERQRAAGAQRQEREARARERDRARRAQFAS